MLYQLCASTARHMMMRKHYRITISLPHCLQNELQPSHLHQQNWKSESCVHFIFAQKVQHAKYERLISFISLVCFIGSRSYGYQTLSQQQAIINLYLREFSSLQISCVWCNGPLSSLLWKPCKNVIWRTLGT